MWGYVWGYFTHDKTRYPQSEEIMALSDTKIRSTKAAEKCTNKINHLGHFYEWPFCFIGFHVGAM